MTNFLAQPLAVGATLPNISAETFKPDSNFLVISEDVPDNITPSGIIIAGHNENKTTLATVIAVGPGIINYNSADATRIPTTSQPGDKILVVTHFIERIKLPNGDLISIVPETDTSIYGRF